MSTPANPGSLHHELAGWIFEINADGGMWAVPVIDGDDPQSRALVGWELSLTPQDVWAFALLFRMPGVRALLNRCELARQHERHVREGVEGASTEGTQ